ncbi:MAG: hypoxanthine phosphoribosyltransferase [Verrucomicrobiae bacterium]|nr:hypoxanthine phosphoribosyltransferase [Verrucomicrobiae bacterium]
MGIDNASLDSRLERILFDQGKIRQCIAEMGKRISEDYEGGDLTIVAVLQGGVLFLADLIREIRLPLRMDSISVASYHGGTSSSGTVTFHQTRLPEVEGRDVIVLDDILDSGRTLAAILDRIRTECRPRSLRSAVLLSKRVERAVPVEADYCGFEIGDEFVVGYGLDYRGEYRNLPVIGVLRREWIDEGI